MKTSFAKTGLARAGLLAMTIALGGALAGCTEATLTDVSPKAHKQLPAELVQSMRAKGMTTTSPIMVRIFKEESKLEVWKQKDNGRYDLAAAYDICKWSGRLGPKFTEGDRQAPEGFYMVRPHQMNPKSSYHLSFNMGFPNAYDRAHGRSGQHLMVHGACSSAGCYSMTDEQVEQIYAFARDAFRGGQTEFQIQAFPFRMTAANMARYKDDPNYGFWKMLKEGYDHFEITKVPPKVDVCEKRYVFNRMSEPGKAFQANAACPVTTQPENLTVAYRSYQSNYDSAFSAALAGQGKAIAPSPSIAGIKEASLVADWSRRRARGEKVTREPPTLERPHILASEQAAPVGAPVVTSAAVAPAMPATTASVPTPSPAAATPQDTQQAEAAPTSAPAAAPQASMRKRLLGMFGG
jgi:murein L,D-transpeptidase YafK